MHCHGSETRGSACDSLILVVETGPDALFGYVFRYGRLGWLVRPVLEVGAWQGKHEVLTLGGSHFLEPFFRDHYILSWVGQATHLRLLLYCVPAVSLPAPRVALSAPTAPLPRRCCVAPIPDFSRSCLRLAPLDCCSPCCCQCLASCAAVLFLLNSRF